MSPRSLPSVTRSLTAHLPFAFSGNFEVGVHIADVSYFVLEGTALDKIASERATSVYLVQKVRMESGHRTDHVLPRNGLSLASTQITSLLMESADVFLPLLDRKGPFSHCGKWLLVALSSTDAFYPFLKAVRARDHRRIKALKRCTCQVGAFLNQPKIDFHSILWNNREL